MSEVNLDDVPEYIIEMYNEFIDKVLGIIFKMLINYIRENK